MQKSKNEFDPLKINEANRLNIIIEKLGEYEKKYHTTAAVAHVQGRPYGEFYKILPMQLATERLQSKSGPDFYLHCWGLNDYKKRLENLDLDS